MITLMQSGICKKPKNAISEDVVGYAGKYYWLLDGATPVTGGQCILQQFLGYLNAGLNQYAISALNPQMLLYQAMHFAKKQMDKENLLVGIKHKPRCTGIVIKVEEENIEYSVLGDSTLCFIDNVDNTCFSITDNRLANFAVKERERMESCKFDSDEYIKARDVVIETERKYFNKSDGFWFVSVSPEAAYMGVNGFYDFKHDTTVLLMSDGLTRFVDVFQCYQNYDGIATLIKDKGASYVFSQLRNLEFNRQDVKRPSLHDDASFMMLDIKKI